MAPKLRSFRSLSVLLLAFPSDHKVAAMTPGITSTFKAGKKGTGDINSLARTAKEPGKADG